jgi:hypothetical protein
LAQSSESLRYKLALRGKTLPLRLYVYGISQFQLMYAIETLNLPVVLTRKIGKADAILALRSHLRKNTNLWRTLENTKKIRSRKSERSIQKIKRKEKGDRL